MTKTDLSKCPLVVTTTILSMVLTLGAHYIWFHDPCNQPHTDIQTLRNTFRAGAAVSELHHAETAHYPNPEWLDSAIMAFEGGAWKKFLDDFVQRGHSEPPEVTGRTLILPEGQDSGQGSGRL